MLSGTKSFKIGNMLYFILLMILGVYGESYANPQVQNLTVNGYESGGYTLFAPLGSTTTYLMDADENFVKTWPGDYTPGHSVYLLSDKSLLRTCTVGKQVNPVFGGTGGSGGIVQLLDWEANLLWSFEHNSENYLLHHDVEYLPNGNILMISWEQKSVEEALAQGRDPETLGDEGLWPDKIIEVEPVYPEGGNIVWEWHVWDHLVQDYDETKPNYGVISEHPEKINLNFYLRRIDDTAAADWTHTNAVEYNAERDQVMITVHNFSEIWIIDHNTTTEEAAGSKGDLLYRWGNPQTYDHGTDDDQKLFVPHDGHWIADGLPGAGDVLIFNNGRGRQDGYYSTVEQITLPDYVNGSYAHENDAAYGPETSTWTYKATPPRSFYADHISGAQRLPNGNTLICNGPAGTFFEVTEAGETVWEYVNPIESSNPMDLESNSVFRAVRYYDSDFESGLFTGINTHEQIPTAIELDANYPNPFNPVTNIDFYLPVQDLASLVIYNAKGQQVATLVNQELNAGLHSFTWQAGSFASGIYFYTLYVGGEPVKTQKMVLIK